jgi:release factor glutamine methyltransferase
MSRQDGGHTVLDLLNKSAAYLAQKGSSSPRLDAELLLANVLGCSRISLYVGFDKPLGEAEVDSYRQLVMRRGRREPVAYIIGKKEFMGRDFLVGAGALVPRPETELMAERGIEAVRSTDEPLAAELCCGSGAAGICLALARKECRLLLTDISDECLSVARANIEAHRLSDRAEVLKSDLFESWPVQYAGKFSVIIANPPYIRSAEIDGLEPEVSQHEPRLALDGGPDGLDLYRRIAQEALHWFRAQGTLVLEVGHDQSRDVGKLLVENGFKDVRYHKDLQGYERVVEAIA